MIHTNFVQRTASPHIHTELLHTRAEECGKAHLGETAGSVPDHGSKTNIVLKQVIQTYFGFPGCIKVLFTLRRSLIRVQ